MRILLYQQELPFSNGWFPNQFLVVNQTYCPIIQLITYKDMAQLYFPHFIFSAADIEPAIF